MSLLSRLFGGGGGGGATEAQPVEHEGCRIFPEPIKEGGRWRLGARVEKDIDGETKVHQLIRADTFASAEEAKEFSISKAKTTIDQLGDSLFK